MGTRYPPKELIVLLLAVVLTVMAVAWTGWRALCRLERIEHQLDLDAQPVVRPALLRLVEPASLSTS